MNKFVEIETPNESFAFAVLRWVLKDLHVEVVANLSETYRLTFRGPSDSEIRKALEPLAKAHSEELIVREKASD